MPQISQNEILHMTILPVFSQFLWNLKFIFLGSRKKLSLVLLFVNWKVKLLNFLMNSAWLASSSETQGQIVGARESLIGRKNMARRKVKNGEKSPWGQCLTRPVSNGRRRSDFWLVPENFTEALQGKWVWRDLLIEFTGRFFSGYARSSSSISSSRIKVLRQFSFIVIGAT